MPKNLSRETRTVVVIETVRLIWVRGRRKGRMWGKMYNSKLRESLGTEKMRFEKKIQHESERSRVMMSFWKTGLRSNFLFCKIATVRRLPAIY